MGFKIATVNIPKILDVTFDRLYSFTSHTSDPQVASQQLWGKDIVGNIKDNWPAGHKLRRTDIVVWM